MPKKVKTVIQIITNTLVFVFFCLLTWRSILYAEELKLFGEVSMTLQLHYYPFVYGVAFASLVMGVVLITYIVNDIKELR